MRSHRQVIAPISSKEHYSIIEVRVISLLHLMKDRDKEMVKEMAR